jgi:hypothetical protein
MKISKDLFTPRSTLIEHDQDMGGQHTDCDHSDVDALGRPLSRHWQKKLQATLYATQTGDAQKLLQALQNIAQYDRAAIPRQVITHLKRLNQFTNDASALDLAKKIWEANDARI